MTQIIDAYMHHHISKINSLAPGRYGCNFKSVIFKIILLIDILISCIEVIFKWTTKDLTDIKSTFVHVMAWCHVAPNHYLNQCWPRFLFNFESKSCQLTFCWSHIIQFEQIDSTRFHSISWVKIPHSEHRHHWEILLIFEITCGIHLILFSIPLRWSIWMYPLTGYHTFSIGEGESFYGNI